MAQPEVGTGGQRDTGTFSADVARLFADHADAIFGYAARRLGSDMAADVTAETFAIAFEKWDRFDPVRGSELAWLYGIASNLIRRQWRTERRRLRTLMLAAGRTDALIDPLLEVDHRSELTAQLAEAYALVASMSETDRDLLFLSAWQGLGPGEIAEALHVPVGTVKSRLSRMRAALRRERGGPSDD